MSKIKDEKDKKIIDKKLIDTIDPQITAQLPNVAYNVTKKQQDLKQDLKRSQNIDIKQDIKKDIKNKKKIQLESKLSRINPSNFTYNEAPPLSILCIHTIIFHDLKYSCQFWLAQEFENIWQVSENRLNFINKKKTPDQYVVFIHKRYASKVDIAWPKYNEIFNLELKKNAFGKKLGSMIKFLIVDINSSSASSSTSRKSVVAIIQIL